MSDKNEPATTEELAISNMFQQEALVRLLEKKGLITRKELLEEIREVQKEQEGRRERN